MKNKLVLKYCPNFYRIVNMDLQEGDTISAKLISIYEDFIFKADLNNLEDINLIKKIDHVLGSYMDDFSFRNEMQSKLFTVKIKKTGKDFLWSVIEAIIHIFNNYVEETTRKIYIARWI